MINKIMIMRKIAIIAAALCLLSACSRPVKDGAVVIKMSDFEEIRADSPFELFEAEPRFVHLQAGEDNSFGFARISKIEIVGDKIYIFDEQPRTYYRVLIFDLDGNPVAKIDSRGRGPNEYLQITDFAVDPAGNIWIADAQKDVLFKYSEAGEMLESRPYTSEISKICCIDGGKCLLGIANWDVSDYAGTALALADASAVIEQPLLPFPEMTDPNYVFGSELSRGKSGVFYNWPIDDYLYEVSYDGALQNTYYFDFGSKTFPEKWRADVEPHEGELAEYQFLVGTYQITPRHIVCGMHKDDKWNAAVIDREAKTIAYFDTRDSGYSLSGQYPGGSIWRLDANCDTTLLPAAVRTWLDAGEETIALLPLD